MRLPFATLLTLAVLGLAACDGAGTAKNPSPNNTRPPATASSDAAPGGEQIPVYGFEVVNSFPHDPQAFTQGLVFHEGALLESTGLEGRSTLRRVELQTGKVLQKVDVPQYFFAEGLTLLGGRLYQLTWKGEKGFVYDPQTFQKTGEFKYDGQGWGLTHDGESLILSDGTDRLRFIDPVSYEVRRNLSVTDRGRPVAELNELEYVRGEIYANVWHQNRIARIDPRTGHVRGWIDLTGLLRPGEAASPEAVLNGIAYDEGGDRLFVTGKLWPKLFEIRLKQR
jgi:glutamine cyclotransferase